MKSGYTQISMVLDRSGSMEPIRQDTIGGVNLFLKEQQAVPGEATISLVQFNDNYQPILDFVPLRDAQPLTKKTYEPNGNTALYGAIGVLLEATGNRLKSLSEDARPEKVIFVIVTDGEENSSHRYEWSRMWDSAKLKEAIDRQTNQYKWEFVYIGANQDAIQNAQQVGITGQNAMNYTANAQGTHDLYRAVSSNARSYRGGQRANMAWSGKQHQAQKDAAK